MTSNDSGRSFARLLNELRAQCGMATRVLGVALVICSLMASLVPESLPWLVLTGATLPEFKLPALLTNTFVARPSSILGVLIFLALGCYYYQRSVVSWWRRNPMTLIATLTLPLIALYGVDLLLGPGNGWGLIIALLLLIWFAMPVEQRWGSGRLLSFCVIVTLVVNLIGGLLLWSWPDGRMAAFGTDIAATHGMSALSGAIIAVWCLMQGRQRLALLNVEAQNLVWLLVIIGVFDFLLVGRIKALLDLVGLLCAWLLVTGLWQPRYLSDRVRLWWLERRVEKRRRSMHIVEDDRTLH